MKATLILLPLIGFSSLFATNDSDVAAIDSLKETLTTDLPSTKVAETLYQIANRYRPLDKDSSMHYAKLSIEQFNKEEKASKESPLPHYLMANIHYAAARYAEAEPYILEAESLALSLPVLDDSLIGVITYVKGNVLATLDRFEESIKVHLKAVKMNQSIGDSGLAARSLLNLGRMYGILGNRPEAKAQYEKATRIHEAIKDSLNWAIGLQNLGSVFSGEGDAESSVEYYIKALGIFLEIGNKDYAVYPCFNISNYYLDRGDLKNARAYMAQAEALAVESEHKDLQVLIMRGMAGIHQKEKNYPLARELMRKAWELAPKVTLTVDQIGLLAEWAEIDDDAKNYQAALGLVREHHKLELKLEEEKNSSFIAELTVKQEAERKEAENILLREKESQLKSREKWGFVVAGLVTLLFIGLVTSLVVTNRRRKAFNKELEGKQATIEQKSQTLESRNSLLQQSIQEKDALMGVVAHDLRSPLTKIMAMVQVLDVARENEAEFDRIKQMIAQIVDGGQDLIDELVLMSNLEKDGLVLELEDIEVKSVLELSVLGFKAQAEAKQIDLQLEAPADSLLGKAHKDYFARIIDNVISNAIKFSPANKSVKVKLAPSDQSHFVISIRDEGPGIPKEELPRIFDKFTRLSPRPTAGESSTGLGLSIAKELVQKMKGTISVESQVGKGTVFTLRFPLA